MAASDAVKHGNLEQSLHVKDSQQRFILISIRLTWTTCGLVEVRGGSPIATNTPYPYCWPSGGGDQREGRCVACCREWQPA